MSNLRSDLTVAYRRLDIGIGATSDDGLLSEQWRPLLAGLGDRRLRHGLRDFAHYCSTAGIPPASVRVEHVDTFLSNRTQACIGGYNDRGREALVAFWNSAVRNLPSWPRRFLPSRQYRTKHEPLPLKAFSSGFQRDCSRYAKWLSGEPVGGQRQRIRAAAPKTVVTTIYHLRLAGTYLHRDGVALDQVGSISELIGPTNVRRLMVHLLKHGDGAARLARLNAAVLLRVAKQWVRLSASEQRELRAIADHLGPLNIAVSGRTRDVLRDIEDSDVMRQLLHLPETLFDAAVTSKTQPRIAAARVRAAVMIGLRLHAPMRAEDMRILRLDEHVVQPIGTTQSLRILSPRQQRKSGHASVYVLPEKLNEMLARYLKDYRPVLTVPDNPYLFPHRNCGPMSRTGFRDALNIAIHRRLGIAISPDQWRTISARLLYAHEANPDSSVERILQFGSERSLSFRFGVVRAPAAFAAFDAILERLGPDDEDLDLSPEPRATTDLKRVADAAPNAVQKLLAFQNWPAADRRKWHQAVGSRAELTSGSIAAPWAEATRSAIKLSYGRWLGYLNLTEPNVLLRAPARRLSMSRLRAYVAHLRQSAAASSCATYLSNLRSIMEAIAPDVSWEWLGPEIQALRSEGRRRPTNHRLVPSHRLVALGHDLMRECDLRTAGGLTSFRDGLMIALLAARPIRRRNLIGATIRDHLLVSPAGYGLRFAETETKNRRSLEIPFPRHLVEPMDCYMDEVRPRFPGASTHDGLWPSMWEGPLCGTQACEVLRKRTKAAFGRSINTHLFRSCAATTVRTFAPDHHDIVPHILGQVGDQVVRLHYDRTSTETQSRSLNEIIEQLRIDPEGGLAAP